MTKNQKIKGYFSRPLILREQRERTPDQREPLEKERDLFMNLCFLLTTVLGVVLVMI